MGWEVIRTFISSNTSEITALSTVVIACFTATLWWATRKILQRGREIERAYVHSGGSFREEEFYPILSNYGKTRAYVTEVCIEVIDIDVNVTALPTPDYSRRRLVGLHLYPGEKDRWARVGGKTMRGMSNPIVYGRVWYEDIFKDKHTSGFIYRASPDGGTFTIKAPEAYTEWS